LFGLQLAVIVAALEPTSLDRRRILTVKTAVPVPHVVPGAFNVDSANPLELKKELEQRIRARIGNRLRNLEIRLSPDGITLCGQAPTFYVKQLVQHSIWEIMPQARLKNTIVVA